MQNKKLTIFLFIISAFLLLAPNFVFAELQDPCKSDADCTNTPNAICDNTYKLCALRCKSDNECESKACDIPTGQCKGGITCPSGETFDFPTGKCLTSTMIKEKAPPEAPASQIEKPFVPVEPTLQIEIPTLQFSKITRDGQAINVPYLADYIAGVYKYAVGIVSLVAIIMIMVGGLRYLTAGGNASAVTSAKEMISGAVIGLFLVLGSYLVLYTVNPDLVSFQQLKIKLIERQVIDSLDASLATAVGDTASDAPAPSFEGCPISLTASPTNQKNNPRSKEFQEKIGNVITGSTIGEKILQIAEAAQKCGTNFGSCGATAEAIYQLAGKSIYNKKIDSVSSDQYKFLATIKCPAGSSGCTAPAMKQAFEKFKSEIGGGWPDSWANKLKPGDVIVVFNANRYDTYGTHSAIFMGWGDGGKAKVIQGGTGKGTSPGNICIKSSCSNPQPLIRTRTY